MHANTLTRCFLSAVLFGTLGANADKSAEDVILAIMPLSESCDAVPEKYRADCRTAKQAALPLVEGFKKYEIYNKHEIGAILALIALESEELRYKRNISPGRPGQGTSNMMMDNFVREYAESIEELKPQLAAITGSPAANETKDAVLDLVVDDKYCFASAAWYYVTKCSEIREALQTGTKEGWHTYVKCVIEAESTPGRDAYWEKAQAAWD